MLFSKSFTGWKGTLGDEKEGKLKLLDMELEPDRLFDVFIEGIDDSEVPAVVVVLLELNGRNIFSYYRGFKPK